jgi:anaerobic selenocysteine-containing dehydrogenase
MKLNQLEKGKIPCEDTGIGVKKSICSICNPTTHCGLDLYVKDGKIIKVQGMLEHANSKGTLCSKGASTRQYVYSKDRLKTPLKRIGKKGSDDFIEITWEEAYQTIGNKLNHSKKEQGPEATAFFVGFTKWMRPFAHRLSNSFGSPNYSTESSTCDKATNIALELNYGNPAGPDIVNTNCLLVWSRNPFHTNTTMANMILNKCDEGMKMIVVDPRITPTTTHADIHLRLKPGTDGALAIGMAHVIINEKLYDADFIEKYAYGFEEYKTYVNEFTLEKASEITGVPTETIIQAARMYAGTKPAAFLPSASPVVHHTNGVQNYRAAFLLIGMTGNFDIKGGNTVSKETYIDISAGFDTRAEEYVMPRPWSDMNTRQGEQQLPIWCELTDEAQAIFLPKQILTGEPYPITSLIGFGLNHRMWPDTNNMIKALTKLDFFVNIELFYTEACKYADIILPACTSVERSEFKCYGNGYTIFTSPAIKPLYNSRSDADIIFDLVHYLDIDDDLMKLGYEKNMEFILEPSGLDIDELKSHTSGMFAPHIRQPKYLKYLEKGFNTPTNKMEFISERLLKYKDSHGYDGLPIYKPSESSKEKTPEIALEYPLVINTGSRLPMFVHSRTFRLSWTNNLRPEPMADINKDDAKSYDIKQGDTIKIITPKDEITLKANISPMIMKGVVSIFHAYKDADVNLLLDAYYTDPISGFPGYKSFLGKIEKVDDSHE